ncbi:hypothetical protein GCM10027160_00730 [Streptomyces calidiresistens]
MSDPARAGSRPEAGPRATGTSVPVAPGAPTIRTPRPAAVTADVRDRRLGAVQLPGEGIVNNRPINCG